MCVVDDGWMPVQWQFLEYICSVMTRKKNDKPTKKTQNQTCYQRHQQRVSIKRTLWPQQHILIAVCVSLPYFHHCLFQRGGIVSWWHRCDRTLFLYSACILCTKAITQLLVRRNILLLFVETIAKTEFSSLLNEKIDITTGTTTSSIQKDAPSRVLKVAEHIFRSCFF